MKCEQIVKNILDFHNINYSGYSGKIKHLFLVIFDQITNVDLKEYNILDASKTRNATAENYPQDWETFLKEINSLLE